MVRQAIRTAIRAGHSNEFLWRYVFNMAPALNYKRPDLAAEPARVVNQWNRDGIALSNASTLLGQNPLFEELRATIERLDREAAPQIEEIRRNADLPGDIGKKTFLHKFFGDRQTLDMDSIFTRFALQKPILDIVNSYMGMYCRFRGFNLWHTVPTRSEPRESQLWHRDPEDRFVLKLFIYFNDVDESAGPFTYAKGTHFKKRQLAEPVSVQEGNDRRTYDKDMELVIPREQWVKAVGPAHTMIFADTHGYHKGGHAHSKDRLAYVAMFTSPAANSTELLTRPSNMMRPTDRELAVAVAGPRRGPWVTI